ncbi:hypothetical protein DXG01_015163, partial [Tephrocybe rancida]
MQMGEQLHLKEGGVSYATVPKIPMNHVCAPPAVQKEYEEGEKQKKLNFNVTKGPTKFMRVGVLEAVAKHIAIDNQSKSADLPSAHKVGVHIHNAFAATLDKLKADIEIKVIYTTSAIWDYSSGDVENRVLDGQLDVIATLCTLSIKTINLFIVHADQLYGPITMQHTNDFILNDGDWKWVEEAKTIIMDLNCVLHYFSAEKQPTLYCTIPAIKNLQTAWEDKLSKLIFALYHNAIRDGLAKLLKYYSQFNEKLAFILALFLPLYFKLHYIQIVWAGVEEQRAEFAKGNHNAMNWVDEAQIIVKNM